LFHIRLYCFYYAIMDFLNKKCDMDPKNLTGIKLLIVEDDLSSRLYLNKILERTGAILLNAGDGQEAINISRENPDIDIILMDIQLPVLDGYSSARKIREFRNNVIIIAQTAYGLSGDMENILASGFDDYIVKPIYSSMLIEKLLAFLPDK
jgi:CheY-like chemotaxis protein